MYLEVLRTQLQEAKIIADAFDMGVYVHFHGYSFKVYKNSNLNRLEQECFSYYMRKKNEIFRIERESLYVIIYNIYKEHHYYVANLRIEKAPEKAILWYTFSSNETKEFEKPRDDKYEMILFRTPHLMVAINNFKNFKNPKLEDYIKNKKLIY